jgi:hypothetical protein
VPDVSFQLPSGPAGAKYEDGCASSEDGGVAARPHAQAMQGDRLQILEAAWPSDTM